MKLEFKDFPYREFVIIEDGSNMSPDNQGLWHYRIMKDLIPNFSNDDIKSYLVSKEMGLRLNDKFYEVIKNEEYKLL